MTEDELVESMRRRNELHPACPVASLGQIDAAEVRLGFALPRLIRRLYLEVGNGGFGPGYGRGVFGVEGGYATDICGGGSIVDVYAALRKAPPAAPTEERWPLQLLPLCDWGCAIWSCLDCRSDDGWIITSEDRSYTETAHRLGSWLEAWLCGVDLAADMFEAGGPPRYNPFTRKMELGRRTKGRPWPTR